MSLTLVQGASRGLGLQFCRHILVARSDARVVATCRNPVGAVSLQQLKEEFPSRIEVLSLDVGNEANIQQVAAAVSEQHQHLDLLINSAGILHPSGRGETSLKDVTSQGLHSTIAVNAIGPVLVGKYFASLLAKGSGLFGIQQGDKVKHCGILVNMSAKVGSITDNGLGGWYSYRMSKAALNMATKNMAVEMSRGRRKVVCVAMHPGTVDTDLSRPYHKNVPKEKLFSIEYSVDCLMKIINGLTVEDSGKFFSWDGKELPF